MSTLRQPSEWGIGKVKTLFSYLEYKVITKLLYIVPALINHFFILNIGSIYIHFDLYDQFSTKSIFARISTDLNDKFIDPSLNAFHLF